MIIPGDMNSGELTEKSIFLHQLPLDEEVVPSRLPASGGPAAPSNITSPPSSASVSLRSLRPPQGWGGPVRVEAETRRSGNIFQRNLVLS